MQLADSLSLSLQNALRHPLRSLLAPVVGGMFGVAVGAGFAALVSLTSGLRPEIR